MRPWTHFLNRLAYYLRNGDWKFPVAVLALVVGILLAIGMMR